MWNSNMEKALSSEEIALYRSTYIGCHNTIPKYQVYSMTYIKLRLRNLILHYRIIHIKFIDLGDHGYLFSI